MKLQVYPLSLSGVMLIRSARTSDARGFSRKRMSKRTLPSLAFVLTLYRITNPFQF